MNGKAKRIRRKPITQLERARIRAAAKAKRNRERIEAAVPEFLKSVPPDDECERPANSFDALCQKARYYDGFAAQPKDYGPKSGILITKPIHGRVTKPARRLNVFQSVALFAIVVGVLVGVVTL